MIARLGLQLGRQLARPLARGDIPQRQHGPLRLGDGGVRDREQLPAGEGAAPEGREDQRRQVIAGAHLWDAAESMCGDARHVGRAGQAGVVREMMFGRSGWPRTARV